MVAGIRRVMTRGACAVLNRPPNRVLRASIQAGHAVDHERARVEDRLAARDRLLTRRSDGHPAAKQSEYERIETVGRAGAGAGHRRRHVQRIVDPDAERLVYERAGTAAYDAFRELARRTVDHLGREQSELEIDDRADLPGRGRRSLRMTGDSVHHLTRQTVADRLAGLR